MYGHEDNEALYNRLKCVDPNFAKNMPLPEAMMFLTLFDTEVYAYTWSGLAALLKARFGDEVDELVYALTHD